MFKSIAIATAILAAGSATAQPYAHENSHGQSRHHSQGAGHGPMMGAGMGRGPVGMLTRQDEQSATDMGLVMNLVHDNAKIRRTVTRLPEGIRTVTESDDAKTAQDIKAHVASMSGRLDSGREFNIFSTTLPVIFENAKNIKSIVEYTAKGAVVTRTSKDPAVIAALQAHADEVTELVNEGPVAFHRGIDARMAMGPGGPRGARAGAPNPAGQGRQQQHAH